MARDLLTVTDSGLYCEAGGFYVDPWRPVERAVITHGHSDHARYGMRRYLSSPEGECVLRLRLGPLAKIDTLEYGETLEIFGVKVSLHPAGHILGSAQVRIEHKGQVWVVSGDYKTEPDRTCKAFEPLRCDVFVTESTFGLPIYRWPGEQLVFDQINAWWRRNQQAGQCSIIYGYALGKAQRILSGLDPTIGPIFCHGAVQNLNGAYRACGVELPPTKTTSEVPRGYDWSSAIVVAPPNAHATPWMRKFGDSVTAFCSGWMAIRGARRRRAIDRGFVLSDHVDWPSLLGAIDATGAERIWVTHGYSAIVAQYLGERGLQAEVVPTRFEGELEEG
ncbi:MAG TPA: ligase-associated DNA damage response exonuclease, partial [Fimbriimonadaceae bacterium]|nr:ligase-associated DNA damage response exonuclease [Fimbriimonadaceae bacterium]